MDKLGNQLANVSLYDVKAYVRKAQNAVLNFSDMESKVREATNNEPWGASTSLMQEIAQGTMSHQTFHEIMPFIYRRFTEKTASEWRQIYKSLQLLEFLIKNGAERVVDYARSHTAVIDMLRHFHYIDSKNRDQGINIRNRAQELLDLLGSVDKIRAERKKSKALNSKTGMRGAVSSSSTTTASSSRRERYEPRYESRERSSHSSQPAATPGFGSHTRRVYGDGGFNGSFAEPQLQAGDDDDFAEYEVGPSASASASAPAPAAAAAPADDDEFDDFQSAPSAASSAAPAPAPASKDSILDLFGAPAPTSSNAAPSFSATPAFTSAPVSAANTSLGSFTSSAPAAAPSAAPPAPAKDAFGSLWETSKALPVKPATPAKTVAPATPAKNGPLATSSKPAVADDDDLLMF